ncbi:hypothetical protein RHSIM_Rhsim12G0053000 [Rhododendron simsii]|uniref:Uncharacterized protein n=1 Tax=Rhododendron simsii TaxID=118357 RepID=A0A834G3Z0_RHOSS|nr:hypothetical protein RHSIM_Rhsim12G0053000 [Rhododendron simsii]
MSFKETPSGGNATFDCSPSGPCVACLYFEKVCLFSFFLFSFLGFPNRLKDEKYRCSETGYRIPLKCEETGASSNEANSETAQKGRLLSDVSTSVTGSQAYITYRSCIPAVNEEKLSVLGFEGIMLGMLFISSSVIYIKRKRSSAPPGSVRIPTSSRF